IAIADECSMAGIVRAHVAAKEHGIKLLVGAQFEVQCDTPFVLTVLATNLDGYGNLCQFITVLRRASEKGTYRLSVDGIRPEALANCVLIASPARKATPQDVLTVCQWLLDGF
ncbi:error-prone DNA polymerase, partial [Stenotrophomonas maltophilia]